jgi:hypothetical protein
MTARIGTGSTSQLPLDEATIAALRERLYPELEKTIRASVKKELLGERAEQPMPLYYDRFVVSETRRLEGAIERNGERIDEFREYIDQRLTSVDVRLTTIETRLTEQKEDIFRHIDRMAFWTRVMNGAVLALLAALIAKLLLG